MNRWVVLFAFPILVAAAPAALTTGAIRDQFGNPIAGAAISALGVKTTTDANGTFALEVNGAQNVTITCRFCKRTQVPVPSNGPIVAIVQRYIALSSFTPADRDIVSLPYAQAASIVSLRPFTLLNNSSAVLPGPRVSTYGASAFGGLLIDGGIPQYDIAGGTSAWRVFPAFDVRNVDVRDQRDAFRYGDIAGGGTLPVETQTSESGSGVLLGGNENAFNISQTIGSGAYNIASSADEDEQSQRFDASAHVPVGDGETFTIGGMLAHDRLFPQTGGGINNGAGGLRAHFESDRANRVFADAIVDRAGYDTTNAYGALVSGLWTDVTTQAGFVTNTPVQLFAALSGRWSTGYYNASAIGTPRVSGAVTQAQALIGAQQSTEKYSFEGGVGVFSVSYTGGTRGVSNPLSSTILTPSFSGTYNLDDRWNVHVSASTAFRLPSLLEAYGSGAFEYALPYARYGSLLESVGYTDGQRVRASLFAMNETVSNLDEGVVSSTGAEVSWQIAPAISLRAWEMHVNDTSRSDYPLVRFARTPMPATVGSAWLTYDLPGGLRIDAIYRRDVIDYVADPHFDASVSAPVTTSLRWFTSTERRHGERYVSAGLRWDLP